MGEIEWQYKAACNGAEITDFFNASKEESKKYHDTEKNLPGRYKYCLPSDENNNTECPVIEECLAYALDKKEQHGIWGGMTSRERKRLRNAVS